jgi:hypothetical protein
VNNDIAHHQQYGVHAAVIVNNTKQSRLPLKIRVGKYAQLTGLHSDSNSSRSVLFHGLPRPEVRGRSRLLFIHFSVHSRPYDSFKMKRGFIENRKIEERERERGRERGRERERERRERESERKKERD